MKLHEQLQRAREKSKYGELDKTELGRTLGWKDNTNVLRIERGRDLQVAKIDRWVEACGYEIHVVPEGSAAALTPRMQQANERQRRVTTALLDLLIDFPDDVALIEYFEKDVARFREQLTARAAVLAR